VAAARPPHLPTDLLVSVSDAFHSTAFLLARNLFLFFLGVFWLALAYWVYKDALRRIDDPWLVGAAVLLALFPPFLGPLVYLLFRPGEYLADARIRELELQEMELVVRQRETCPVCRASVDAEFLACPVCKTKLKQACAGCGAPLEAVWQMCPWCETPNDVPAVVGLGQTAANPGALDELLRSQAQGVGSPARRRAPAKGTRRSSGADTDPTPVPADGPA
jgi:double zinc ribbon protein